MIDKPEITQTVAQPVAFIRLTVPREQIQEVMGPGRDELIAEIANQGIDPVGPWFTHHLKMDPDVFDFEICVPTALRVSAVGRVGPGELPARTVARTIYHGAYDGLASAWTEFDAWIAAQGLTTGQDLWEVYVTGPESSPDPAEWRTELSRPLAE